MNELTTSSKSNHGGTLGQADTLSHADNSGHLSPVGDPNAPRWVRRKSARPSEILQAALDLFVERGYANTRAEDVAKKAGVSKGTVYLYFTDKESLFKAVIRENIVPLIAQFKTQTVESKATSEDLVRQFFESWWSLFGATKLSGLCKLIMSEAGNFPEVARFFHAEVIQPTHDLLIYLLQRGAHADEFRSVAVKPFAHLMISPLVMQAISAHSLWLCCPQEDLMNPEEMIAIHVDNILRSLRRESV